MKALLILCGIHDPKWPLEWSDADRLPTRRPDRFLLSPFDEAAVELALRLRERHDGELEAVVVGGHEVEKLARVVAAYNLPVSTLQVEADDLLDTRRLGEALAAVVDASQADIVLMGREFGDLDDGALAPWLASRLGRLFFALAQDVSSDDGALAFVRERADAEETLTVRASVLVSVTNARRNRLRRPLVKNVMAARQASIRKLGGLTQDPASAVALLNASVTQAGRGRAAGQILTGSIKDQASALAALMADAGAGR